MIYMLRLMFMMLYLAGGGALELKTSYTEDVPCGPIESCSYETLDIRAREDWTTGFRIGCNFFDHGAISCGMIFPYITNPANPYEGYTMLYCSFTAGSHPSHGCMLSDDWMP